MLDLGDSPDADDVADFEALCFALRLANGTFRTTYRNRFTDLNALVQRLIQDRFTGQDPIRIEDRAVSSALTAYEWASVVLPLFPKAQFEASDLLLDLFAVTLPNGVTYVAEPDGSALQAIAPPFVVSLCHREPRRFPLNRLVAGWHRRRWETLDLPPDWIGKELIGDLRVKRIPFVHPEARAFAANEPRFQVKRRSVFEVTPGGCHVLRTMNILNRAYFSTEELRACRDAIHESVLPDGLWVLGRTSEDSFENHASILRREPIGWTVMERLGNGSDIEDLVLESRS